jgi:two-component system response regulator HydG
VKLLRAIETRTVRRLGGKKEINVDIRIVAATNRDLQSAIADGDLREDLYYRLAVVEVFLPPLRERVGDIKLLANEFLARYAMENNKKVNGFEDASWDWILAYHWPGNVRELKNAVERAVIMTRGTTIGPQDITPRHIRLSGENHGSLTIQVGSSMADARRKVLLGTFASTDGDPIRTAKLLGVTPGDVQREIIAIVRGGGEEDGRRGAPPASIPKSQPRAVAAKAPAKGKPKAKSGRAR